MVLDHPAEITEGYTPVIDIHTTHLACKFDKILSKVERYTGKVIEENPKSLKCGESGIVRLIPTKPVVVEVFGNYGPLGRFAIRDNKTTVAVGVVKEVTKRAQGGKSGAPAAQAAEK